MKDNRLLIAGVIGALSTIVAEIMSFILLNAGIGKYSTYQLNSLMITVSERPSEVMGLILNFFVGSTVSALLFVVFRKWGYNYIIIKCAMIGLYAWFIWEMLFTFSIEGKTIALRPVSDYYSHMVSSILFGVSMGLLMKRFVFKKPFFNRRQAKT